MAMHPFLKYSMMGMGPLAAGAMAAPKGFFNDLLWGKQGQTTQTPLYTPEQQGAMSKLLNMGMQNADFGPIENKARTQFMSQTAPSLAERFHLLGGPGTRYSSSELGGMMGAGKGLEESLASLRSQYGMQQLGMGLGRQFEPTYQAGHQGIVSSGLGSLLSMLPYLALM